MTNHVVISFNNSNKFCAFCVKNRRTIPNRFLFGLFVTFVCLQFGAVHNCCWLFRIEVVTVGNLIYSQIAYIQGTIRREEHISYYSYDVVKKYAVTQRIISYWSENSHDTRCDGRG
jgi:hypothetical protein